MALLVKAWKEGGVEGTRLMVGYYKEKKRFQGEEFELEKESDFSEKWMKWVKGPLSQEPHKEDKGAKDDPKKKGSGV